MLGASAAGAAPVNYSEAGSGDLNGTQVFSFDVGSNVISGSTNFCDCILDNDQFDFTLPAGTQLTDVTIVYSGLTGTTGIVSWNPALFIYYPSGATASYAEAPLVSASIPAAMPLVVSLPSGDFPLSGSGLWGALLASGGSYGGSPEGTVDYSVTFAVAGGPGVVPLPAALPLFASGLGALGILGLRRKRKKGAAKIAA